MHDKVERAIATVVVIATIFGGLGWAIPSLRDYLGEQAGLAWTLAFVASVVSTVLWATLRRHRSEQTSDRQKLEQALDEEKVRHSSTQADLQAALSTPTQQDQILYNEILDIFPLESSLVGKIEIGGFTGKQWSLDYFKPLNDFDILSKTRYFDSPKAEAVRLDFLKASDELWAWVVREGELRPSRNAEMGKSMYVVAPASKREGGLVAFDEATLLGQSLARQFAQARREFEARCRKIGLSKIW